MATGHHGLPSAQPGRAQTSTTRGLRIHAGEMAKLIEAPVDAHAAREMSAIESAGIEEWIGAGNRDVDALLDLDAGTPVRWVDGVGFVEGEA